MKCIHSVLSVIRCDCCFRVYPSVLTIPEWTSFHTIGVRSLIFIPVSTQPLSLWVLEGHIKHWGLGWGICKFAAVSNSRTTYSIRDFPDHATFREKYVNTGLASRELLGVSSL